MAASVNLYTKEGENLCITNHDVVILSNKHNDLSIFYQRCEVFMLVEIALVAQHCLYLMCQETFLIPNKDVHQFLVENSFKELKMINNSRPNPLK